ncbi:hypothetical protein FALBO_14379 [Fusarium albosuccineum]|uniref:Uncharacterized protein n=1 Tax=Fusarium albosuccineum TaxID=1237068 RepID=A0A8H4KY55_9HYPO|nr:hypothetical protein FALBO_14379 [Fusarium albosuccineum]
MTERRTTDECCKTIDLAANSKDMGDLAKPVNYANGLCEHNALHNCFNPAQANSTLCKILSDRSRLVVVSAGSLTMNPSFERGNYAKD